MKFLTRYSLSETFDMSRNLLRDLYGSRNIGSEYILPGKIREFLTERKALIARSVLLSATQESALASGKYLEPVIGRVTKDINHPDRDASIILADIGMMKMLASDEALRMGNANELEIHVATSGEYSTEKIQEALKKKLNE